MSRERWWQKANAFAQAWAATFGNPPSQATTALGLSVAEHETHCGDAWPGHNWGACTKGALTATQRAALAAAGIHATLHPPDSLAALEQRATDALAAAGCPVPSDAEIHVDSSPAAGAYFTFFGRFDTDTEGAEYFIHVLAESRASCLAVLRQGSQPYALAGAMYRSHYFTGFHDPHEPGGDEANIADYAGALSRLLPGIQAALVGWTPGAEPGEEMQEPKAPPDVSTVLGVQQALNALVTDCAPLVEDGIDGPHTRAAVATWQRAHGLPVTGSADDATRAALRAALWAF